MNSRSKEIIEEAISQGRWTWLEIDNNSNSLYLEFENLKLSSQPIYDNSYRGELAIRFGQNIYFALFFNKKEDLNFLRFNEDYMNQLLESDEFITDRFPYFYQEFLKPITKFKFQDYDYLDVKHIDVLCNSLVYHHFVPHRPIKENGQMSPNASKEERLNLFCSDMTLLSNCNMLIAVLLYNDPGTLIEIGLAAQRGIPTLVYDPLGIADNCMLTELPVMVSGDLDKIISKVFTEYSKQYRNGTV